MLHAASGDGRTVGECQEQAAVRRGELVHSREIVLDCLVNRQAEAVPGLQAVVTPGQVLQPQALDQRPVPRQYGILNVGHWNPPTDARRTGVISRV